MNHDITTTEAVAHHLAGCAAALYEGLGTRASTFTDDSACIFAFTAARRAGSWRHRFDALAPHRKGTDALFTLAHAGASGALTSAGEDSSGLLAVAVTCHVVGTRLMVSLRDAVASAGPIAEAPLIVACQATQWELVRLMGDGGQLLATRLDPEDPSISNALGPIEAALSASGWAESLGIGRVG
jgi:hypothetical protein